MSCHPWFELLALLALLLALVFLVSTGRKLRGTTLLWPWAWCLPALVAWGAVLLGQLATSASAAELLPWRYAAGVLSLAPGMSLLGARRPHHRAWQWVVLSLLGVLLLPLGHWALAAGGTALRLHGVWRGFLLLLLALGWLHYGLTRHALAALLVLGAQLGWLGPLLLPRLGDWGPGHLGAGDTALAALVLSLAPFASWLQSRRREAARRCDFPSPELAAAERLLRDFRGWFGDFWFQRLRWQVMLAAQRAGWPVVITPLGTLEGAPSAAGEPGWERALSTCLEQFLRRFVSPQWLERHACALPSDRSHDAVPRAGSR